MEEEKNVTKKEYPFAKNHLSTPKQIKAYLDQYVIGQDEAKKILSVAVYNHYKKVISNLNFGTEFEKSNIILQGATGSGKTLLIKTIAKMLGVPCYIQDCTKLTASGYVGEDVENCLTGLLRTCGYKVEVAETGIVCLDEIDKLAKKDAGPSITRDVSGECVQQSLLKIVEGDNVGVMPEGGRKHPEAPLTYINTSNILFVGMGAFVGLDEVVKKRMGSTIIGFDREEKTNNIDLSNPNEYVNSEDLKEYGFIPELVGRFPIVTYVNKLTKEDLKKILKEPKNSIIEQYKKLLEFDNTKLIFTEDALDEIVDIAYKIGTGARALRSICEDVMTDIMFNAPDNIGKDKMQTIKITKKDVVKLTEKKYQKIG